ncbi:MAG: Fic family protein [Gammaproteobacteria bacterium]
MAQSGKKIEESKTSDAHLNADEDFPRSERWRLCTDEWQQPFGPENFRKEYFIGINKGLELVETFLRTQQEMTSKELEKLHDSFYETEKTNRDQPLGFRKGINGKFGVYLPALGTEYTAGISEKGYAAFIAGLKLANGRYASAADTGKYYFVIETRRRNFKYIPFLNGIIKDDYLFSKKIITDESELFNIFEKSGNSFYGISIHLTRSSDDVVKTVDDAFKKFHTTITDAEAQEQKKEPSPAQRTAILRALAELIGTLHANHGFSDGNGRTHIFLLLNYYLLKFFNTRCIVQTPAHFLGYSVDEIVAEIEAGIKKFEDYKITKAKDYVFSLLKKDAWIEKTEDVKNELIKNFSKKPLVALAQINELYLQLIEQQKMKFVDESQGSSSFVSHSIFSPLAKQIQPILALLRDIYFLMVNNQINMQQSGKFQVKNNHDWVASKQAFKDIIARHNDILQDETISESAAYGKNSLKSAVTETIETSLKDMVIDKREEDLLICIQQSSIEQEAHKNRF